MSRATLLPLLALVLAPAAAAWGATSVTGEVQASWTDARRVHVSTDAVLRPLHAVTISVSGQVDINREEKEERKCAVFGLDCHYDRWTEHHWNEPSQWPIEVQLRDLDTGEVVLSQTVGPGPFTITAPDAGANFGRRYELVARLAEGGIDPARSGGAYTVRLSIDARPRLQKLAAWLASVNPPVDLILSQDILDAPMLADQAKEVAGALRQHALSRVPVATDRDAHERLIRKAVEIAPDDPLNLIALANYFVATGSPVEADNQLRQTIAAIGGKTDPVSQRTLGDAYATRADVALAISGGVDSASAERAAAYLEQAVGAYHTANRRDLEASALVARGRVLRGIRSPAALRSAVTSFRTALGLVPASTRVDALATRPDGSAYGLLAWDEIATIGPIDGSGAVEQLEDAVPVLWDRFSRRMLIARGGRPMWLDLSSKATTLAPDYPEGALHQASGAVLSAQAGEISFTSAEGRTAKVPFGTVPTCKTAPPVPAGPGRYAARLGEDGRTLAIFCFDTVRFYDASGGAPVQITEKNGVSAPPLFQTPFLSAGPRGCGVLLDYPPEAPGLAPRLQLLKPDGTLLTLDAPAEPLAAGVLMPLPAPAMVAFSADGRVIVSRNPGPYHVFSCATGTREASVPRPPRGRAEEVSFILNASLKWLDNSTLADIDYSGGRVILLDWPSKTTKVVALPKRTSQLQQLVSALTMMAPAPGSAIPRSARPDLRLRTLGPGPALPPQFKPVDNHAALLAGAVESEFQLLDGGRFLLAVDREDQPATNFGSVVDLQTGNSSAPQRNVVAIPGNGAWASFANDGQTLFAKGVVLHSGMSSGPVIPFPAITPELRSAAVAGIARFDQQYWSTRTPAEKEAQPPLVGQLAIPAMMALAGTPDAISALHAERPTLPSLTGLQGTAGQLSCAQPAGRDAAGEAQVFGPVMDGQLVTVLYPNGNPSFRHGPVMSACFVAFLVPGRAPAIVGQPDPFGRTGLQWFTQGGWRSLFEGNEVPQVDAGWATGDAGGLLLAHAEGPGVAPIYTLYRFSASGAAPACAACKTLDLNTAYESLAEKLPPVAATRLQRAGPRAMIMIDPDGIRVAYPDGADLVVRLLASDRELLRVKLARPAALTRSNLVVDNGDGEMQVHTLPDQ